MINTIDDLIEYEKRNRYHYSGYHYSSIRPKGSTTLELESIIAKGCTDYMWADTTYLFSWVMEKRHLDNLKYIADFFNINYTYSKGEKYKDYIVFTISGLGKTKAWRCIDSIRKYHSNRENFLEVFEKYFVTKDIFDPGLKIERRTVASMIINRPELFSNEVKEKYRAMKRNANGLLSQYSFFLSFLQAFYDRERSQYSINSEGGVGVYCMGKVPLGYRPGGLMAASSLGFDYKFPEGGERLTEERVNSLMLKMIKLAENSIV